MKKTSPKKVIPKNFLSYLSMMKGSVGSHAYQKQWAEVDGKLTNIAATETCRVGFL